MGAYGWCWHFVPDEAGNYWVLWDDGKVHLFQIATRYGSNEDSELFVWVHGLGAVSRTNPLWNHAVRWLGPLVAPGKAQFNIQGDTAFDATRTLGSVDGPTPQARAAPCTNSDAGD